MATTTAKGRYLELARRRDPFLRRARECAAYTIPAILPPEGFTDYSSLPQPYSGIGARLVDHLVNKLVTALYPPGMSSFRLTVAPEVLLKAGAEATPPDIDRNLVLVEKLINSEIEARQWRSATYSSLLHLCVTGNVMEQTLPDNTVRVFRLDQYVVVRSPSGVLLEFVIRESHHRDSLPPNMQALTPTDGAEMAEQELYTWGKRQADGVWKIHQEINETPVPRSEGRWPVLPFRALRWSHIPGEAYGRGKVEDHLPDLKTVDGLTKAVIEGNAMAAKHYLMIRPNAAGGFNLRRRLAKASNGDIIVGNPEDLGMLKFDNVSGMQIVEATLERLTRFLMASFLLNGGAQRDAERVTAYELRIITEELEGALGGVYSSLSADLQRERLRRLIIQMQDQKKLPMWPDGDVEPTILTGLEALGREKDVQRVVTATELTQAMSPEAQLYIKWPVLLMKLMNGLGIPDAVNTEDEVQAKIAQQQQAATVQEIAAKGGAEAVKQAVRPQQ